MKDHETIKILSVLSAAYPSFPLTTETIQVYAECLSDMPYAELKKSALAHIGESRYFPTVAELIDRVKGSRFAILDADDLEDLERRRRAVMSLNERY